MVLLCLIARASSDAPWWLIWLLRRSNCVNTLLEARPSQKSEKASSHSPRAFHSNTSLQTVSEEAFSIMGHCSLLQNCVYGCVQYIPAVNTVYRARIPLYVHLDGVCSNPIQFIPTRRFWFSPTQSLIACQQLTQHLSPFGPQVIPLWRIFYRVYTYYYWYACLLKTRIYDVSESWQSNYLQIQDFYSCVFKQSSQKYLGTWESHTRMKAESVIQYKILKSLVFSCPLTCWLYFLWTQGPKTRCMERQTYTLMLLVLILELMMMRKEKQNS